MNRAQLGIDFAASTSRSQWKTFVLEAHPHGDAAGLINEAFGHHNVRTTDDIHLHRVEADVPFFIDHLDERFWSLHTAAPNSAAAPYLKGVVEAWRELDWMWLPSDHLRDVWPGTRPVWVATDFVGRRLAPSGELADLRFRARGDAAEKAIQLLESGFGSAVSFSSVAVDLTDEHWGTMAEAISRDGRFVAHGDDFGFHQAVVQRVIARYRRFVESVERSALRWVELPEGGARLEGAPVLMQFGRRVPDLELFLERLFSAREPFRLWGMPQMTGVDLAEVEAVDLHVGQQLRFDITPTWMRVYMFRGGCGNTIARLVSNLQHHLDGKLRIVDPKIDAGLRQTVS